MKVVPELFGSRPSTARRAPMSQVGAALLVLALAAGGGLGAFTGHRAPVVAGILLGFYLGFAIRVADQWEKAIVLRIGRYRGLRGPGPFHIIPIVDRVSGKELSELRSGLQHGAPASARRPR